MNEKKLKYQRKLLKELRSGKEGSYEEASIYTILFDLVEGNGLDDVFMGLHNLASDLDRREEFENMFEEARKWEWSK